MALADKVLEIVNKNIENTSFFVVDMIVNTFRNNTRIAIFLDGDNGIGVDDCAEISRKVQQQIEDENLIEKDYTLEISSPGLDKPLKLVRQYQKNIGRKLKLVMNDKTEKTGKLIAVTETEIDFLEEKKEKKKITEQEIKIPFSDINKANVIVVFN